MGLWEWEVQLQAWYDPFHVQKKRKGLERKIAFKEELINRTEG